MNWVIARAVIGYLLLDRQRLVRERNKLQMLWLQEALDRREEQQAVQQAFDDLMEENYEAFDAGSIWLSLN